MVSIKTNGVRKPKKSRKIVKILLLLVVVILLGGVGFISYKYPQKFLTVIDRVLKKTKELTVQEEKNNSEFVRVQNIDRSNVTLDTVTYSIDENGFKGNSSLIYKPEGKLPKENALSIIDGWAYFSDEYGLIRVNIDKKSMQPMYYDRFEFAVVSDNNIYGLRNGKVVRTAPDESQEILDSYIRGGIKEVYDNMLVYSSANGVSFLDLETEEITDIDITSKIIGIERAENLVSIKTSTGNIDVDITDISNTTTETEEEETEQVEEETEQVEEDEEESLTEEDTDPLAEEEPAE